MQDKKNLLLVVGEVWFTPCGISNMTKLLLNYLIRSNLYNIKILIQGNKKSNLNDNYIIDIGKKIDVLKSMPVLINLVYWSDIIHYQSTSKIQILVNNVANFFRKRQIITFHGTDIWYANSADKHMQNLLNSVDDIISLSNGHLRELERRFNIRKSVYKSIVPYAFLELDTKINFNREKKTVFKIIVPKGFRYIKKSESDYYCKGLTQILPSGFLVSGQEYLVEAIKELNFEGINNIEILFIGDGDDKEIKDYVVKNNLTKNIIFLGRLNQKEVYEYYSQSNAMVCPSILESWSNIQIEALYFNIPVIASNTEGTKDQSNIYNFNNLYVFEIGDVQKLKEQIKNLMKKKNFDFESDKKLLNQKLTIDSIGKRFLNIYNRK